MRPIIKGDIPIKINGNPIPINTYSVARPFLIERVGDYCSYCENQITNPAVEHIQPKSIATGIVTNWYNFLLSCLICNSIKGSTNLSMTDYYWPDIHNTFLLFDFHPNGAVTLKSNLHSSIIIKRAENTLKLTGLDRYSTESSESDRRWKKRAQAYGKANDSLTFYIRNNKPKNYITSIINTATSTGFWSVWITVFQHEVTVLNKLNKAFLNTFHDFETTDINRL